MLSERHSSQIAETPGIGTRHNKLLLREPHGLVFSSEIANSNNAVNLELLKGEYFVTGNDSI